MERVHDLASLMRSHPNYRAPGAVTAANHKIIESGAYTLLQ